MATANWHACPHVKGYFRSPMTVGQRITELREARGWTQQQLAQKAGVSRTTISSHEADRFRPLPGILAAYARAFDMPFKQFVSVTNVWRDYQYVSHVQERDQ